jgi:hypothetical protein
MGKWNDSEESAIHTSSFPDLHFPWNNSTLSACVSYSGVYSPASHRGDPGYIQCQVMWDL